MVLLNPVFLYLGLGAVSLPIVIHLMMKRRARTVPFSTLRFLITVDLRLARRNRLKEILLLLLRAAALLVLALGLSRPYLPGTAGQGVESARVIVLDDSASMNRTMPGQSCFDSARASATSFLETIDDDDRTALLLLSELEKPLLSMEKGLLMDRLRSAVPGYGGSDPGEAYRLACECLNEAVSPLKEIVFFTDFPAVPWQAFTKRPGESEPVRLRVVAVNGTASPNLTVEQAMASPLPGGGCKVFVQLRNQGNEPQRKRLTLEVENAPDQEVDLLLPPLIATEHTFKVAFEKAGPHRGVVRLGPDILEADNLRYFLVEDPAARSVLLVAPHQESQPRLDGGFYIERALQPPGSDQIDLFRAERLDGLDLAPFDALVLVNPARLPEQVLDYVRRGGGLLVLADEPFLPDSVGRESDGMHLEVAAQDHPLLKPLAATHPPLDLSTPVFRRHLEIPSEEESHTLLRFAENGAPALVEKALGRGRILFFMSACAPAGTDFPFKVSFVPFLHSAVTHLFTTNGHLQQARVNDPFVEAHEYSAGPGEIWRPHSGPAGKPGFYRSESGSLITVNIDPCEGDLTRSDMLPGIDVHEPESVLEIAAQGSEEGVEIMPFLLLVALGLILIEAFLTNRRLARRGAPLFLLLRCLALLIVAALFFRPACTLPRPASEAGGLVVLIDGSQSMNVRDERLGASRFELAQTLWEETLRPRLEGDHALRVLRFGETLRDHSPEAPAEDRASDLGGAIRALRDQGIEKVMGLVLFTDGCENGALSALDEAVEISLPVHVVGLGVPQGAPITLPDAAIIDLRADDKVLSGDRTEVSAVAQAPGPLTVRFEANGTLIHTQALHDQGRHEINFDWTPPSPGIWEIAAEIEEQEGEAFLENNRRTFAVEVSASTLSLLLFESRPRWEFKFLKRVLEGDAQIAVTSLLRTGTDRFLQQGHAPVDLRRGFPGSLEGLNHFDCIVLGDVGRDDLGPEGAALLRSYVEEGTGGLIVSGGRRVLGREGIDGTRLESAIPVNLSPAVEDLPGPFPVRITPEGDAHPVLHGLALQGLVAENIYPVQGMKPGGMALAMVEAGRSTPLLAVHRFGKGRSAAVLSDTTWKWALHERSSELHRGFWGRLVRWASGRDVAEEESREPSPVQLDRIRLARGESARLTVKDSGEDLRATIVDETDRITPLPLTQDQTLVNPVSSGFHEIRVERADGKEVGSARLYVDRDQRETNRILQDRERLLSLARATKGGYYTAVRAHEIPGALHTPGRDEVERVSFRLEESPWIYLLVVVLLSLEWALRRRAGIV